MGLIITFEDSKLEKMANNIKLLQKEYGKICSEKIRARLDDLSACNTLEDAKMLPGKYHELTGNRKGQIAVHVEEPKRLVFVPDYDAVPLKNDGSMDWKGIERIKVIEVVNYHGK